MLVTVLLLVLVYSAPLTDTCGDRLDMYHELERILKTESGQVIPELEKLKKEWEACGLEQDSTYSRILHILGRSYWEKGDPDRGVELTLKAIEINSLYVPFVARKELCNNYFNLGAIYAQKGALLESLESFGKSIEIGLQYPEKLFIVSKAYSRLANLHFGQGDPEKSVLAGERGYRIGRELEDPAVMSSNLLEKAQALIELGSLEEARQSLREVVALSSKNNIHLGMLYTLYAEIDIREKNFDRAVSHFEKSFSEFKKEGFEYGCGQVCVNLGFLYAERMGRYKSAMEQYGKALRYFNEPQDRGLVISSIAALKVKTGLTDDALHTNGEAIKEFLGDAYTPSNSSLNPLADVIRQVLDKTNLLAIIIQKGDILLRLYDTKAEQPLLQNALACYMLADTMVDFMRWEHSGKASKLFWREKTRGLYENAIKACYLLDAPGPAFHFFEKSRAALLQDELNDLGAAQLLQPAEQTTENELKARIRHLQEQLSDQDVSESRKSLLRNQLFDARESLAGFVKGLAVTNPSYYAYKYDNRVPSLAELRQDILDPGQSYLSYFIGDSAVYGFYFDSKPVLRKIDLHTYREALQAYQHFISDKSFQNKDFTGYLEASHHLYRLLIEPFRIDAGKRLVISPDGKILPFAALSKSAQKESYLVRTNAISYTYSVNYLHRSRRKSRGPFAFKSFFGMAPVEFPQDQGQSTLPGSDKALQKLDGQFIFSRILEREAATRRAFTTNLARYPIVQLFTHASADTSEKAGTSPTLFFADSSLRLTELEAPARNATELLVLSACETGLGVEHRGEGVFSLARGFAGIGIPSVLTTLWKVENQAVYEITRYFYEGLADSLPLDEALRNAQLKWLETSEKSGQLPYLWAGNVLIGNTDSISAGFSPSHVRTGVILVLVLFAGMLYLRKRAVKGDNH